MDNNKKLSSEVVYRKIKDRILSLKLQPDDHLTEIALAAEFKVSRTPIREALRRLERENLIYIIPHKGVFIRGFSPNDINEIFTIREALEGISIRNAAEFISDQNLKYIEERQALAEEEMKKENYEKSSILGNCIHEVALQIVGNKRLLQIVSEYKELTSKLQSIATYLPGQLDKSNRDHVLIFEALKARNGPLAEKRMRNHIASVRQNLVNEMKNRI